MIFIIRFFILICALQMNAEQSITDNETVAGGGAASGNGTNTGQEIQNSSAQELKYPKLNLYQAPENDGYIEYIFWELKQIQYDPQKDSEKIHEYLNKMSRPQLEKLKTDAQSKLVRNMANKRLQGSRQVTFAENPIITITEFQPEIEPKAIKQVPKPKRVRDRKTFKYIQQFLNAAAIEHMTPREIQSFDINILSDVLFYDLQRKLPIEFVNSLSAYQIKILLEDHLFSWLKNRGTKFQFNFTTEAFQRMQELYRP